MNYGQQDQERPPGIGRSMSGGTLLVFQARAWNRWKRDESVGFRKRALENSLG
jgi:hypothetical protein